MEAPDAPRSSEQTSLNRTIGMAAAGIGVVTVGVAIWALAVLSIGLGTLFVGSCGPDSSAGCHVNNSPAPDTTTPDAQAAVIVFLATTILIALLIRWIGGRPEQRPRLTLLALAAALTAAVAVGEVAVLRAIISPASSPELIVVIPSVLLVVVWVRVADHLLPTAR